MNIDAVTPPAPPGALAFSAGGRSPEGHVFAANTRYLTLDGRPWFPVMGEFHYSRYPAAEWETELLKMKAGGIAVISTYVFWIHHEETENSFDWSGQRDLRRFISLCAKHGLLAWVRIGPWDHGEVRNGGFPDWLVNAGLSRSNDPAYLARVKAFYGQIGAQLQGLYWKDNGPIVGVQIENEYHPAQGGIEHMRTLLQLARGAGIDAPFYTATGWDNAAVPPTGFLPVFGGYTDQFWSASLRELPPNQNFFFTPIRAEDNVMGDLSPKNASYQSRYDGFPFLTAEMGGGMAIAYHRRPIMKADDSTAAALVKLGAGITGLGYYMYHGGTNPDGRTSLQETQAAWNGYNDMEAKSYDFQAPLGEFGQVNESYRTLRLLHLFLHDFGAFLVPMAPYFPAEMPKNRDDISTPRVTARMNSEGTRGFIFINNYQRSIPLGTKENFAVRLRLPGETLQIPREPTTIPSGCYTHWPVNFEIGGATIKYATAELICQLDDPATLVFSAWPGLPAEFVFHVKPGDTLYAPAAKVTQADGVTTVSGIEPGLDLAIRLTPSGGKSTQILLLPRERALHLVKLNMRAGARLALSPGDIYFTEEQVHLSSRDPASLRLAIFPPLPKPIEGFRMGDRAGIFQEYISTAAIQAGPDQWEVEATKAAGPSEAAKINPNPRRRVALEPADADFDRAASWKIRFPSPGTTRGAGRPILEISYEGDVARIYSGSHFDNDNFYKGTPWEIGLWRFSPEELARGLDLKILPLRQDTPLFLEQRARVGFPNGQDVLRLKGIRIIREYESVLNLARG